MSLTLCKAIPTHLYRLGTTKSALALTRPMLVVASSSSSRPLFSSHATRTKNRDEELCNKSFQDAFDESDWIETGKRVKEEIIIHDLIKAKEAGIQGKQDADHGSGVLKELKTFEEKEKQAMKHAKVFGQRVAHKWEDAVHTMKEKTQDKVSSDDGAKTMSRDELNQKSFNDAFDESDAIEKGKDEMERIAVIAERVESMKY